MENTTVRHMYTFSRVCCVYIMRLLLLGFVCVSCSTVQHVILHTCACMPQSRGNHARSVLAPLPVGLPPSPASSPPSASSARLRLLSFLSFLRAFFDARPCSSSSGATAVARSCLQRRSCAVTPTPQHRSSHNTLLQHATSCGHIIRCADMQQRAKAFVWVPCYTRPTP